jgi:hypothetical protein
MAATVFRILPVASVPIDFFVRFIISWAIPPYCPPFLYFRSAWRRLLCAAFAYEGGTIDILSTDRLTTPHFEDSHRSRRFRLVRSNRPVSEHASGTIPQACLPSRRPVQPIRESVQRSHFVDFLAVGFFVRFGCWGQAEMQVLHPMHLALLIRRTFPLALSTKQAPAGQF